MTRTFIMLFLGLLSAASCSDKRQPYDLHITSGSASLNGKVMTTWEMEREIVQDSGRYGGFSGGSVHVHIESNAPYGRILSCVGSSMLCLDEYIFFIGAEEPVRVYLRNADYPQAPEELITIAEKNIRTQHGVISFQDLDQYLAESKAKNTNIRVIVNATTNAAMIDFRSALLKSEKYTKDVLWSFGDGSIVYDNGDWERWRPRGNLLAEYKVSPQPASPGDSLPHSDAGRGTPEK